MPAHATIYKCIDQNGTRYSNHPCPAQQTVVNLTKKPRSTLTKKEKRLLDAEKKKQKVRSKMNRNKKKRKKISYAKKLHKKQQKAEDRKHRCALMDHQMAQIQHQLRRGHTILQGEKLREELARKRLRYKRSCINYK